MTDRPSRRNSSQLLYCRSANRRPQHRGWRRREGRMSVRHEPEERLRKFHLPHAHLESAFGNDWFGKRAENFARFFGTPTFLCGTTHPNNSLIWRRVSKV